MLFEDIALKNTDFSLFELKQIYVFEGIINRVSKSIYKKDLVLRGGMMSRHWYAPQKWMPSDIDFMVETPISTEEMETIWKDIFAIDLDSDDMSFDLETLESETTWAEAKDPGLRLFVSAKIINYDEDIVSKIDISYADPVVPKATFRAYPSIFFEKIEQVKMVPKEASAGWKFYGLFERSNNKWRAKDLFGLYWLIIRHNVKLEWVINSFKETSIERGTPLQIAARFFENGFAQGRDSRRQWRVFCKEHPSFDLPLELQEVIDVVQEKLKPHFLNIISEYSNIVEVGSRGFPVIDKIDEILLAIKERNEFVVLEKDNYQIVDYKQQIKYSFLPAAKAMHPSVVGIYALRRECRGLIFNKEGSLVHRKLHKFFRVGELEETQIENIDWSQKCSVLEKLDGSLVAPVIWNGKLKWTTRKGISSIANQAEVFAEAYSEKISNNDTGYIPMIMELIESGWTPCFEWCSRQHPIVLDYEEDQLILTAIRNNYTGHYLNYEKMVALAVQFQIPFVQTKAEINTLEEAKTFITKAEQERVGEGYVLRFPDDRFYKVKNNWYIKLHQLVANANNEIYIWRAVMNKELDEMLASVAPSLRPPIQIFSITLNNEIANMGNWVEQLIKTANADERIIQAKDEVAKNKLFSIEYVQQLDIVRQKIAYTIWHKSKKERTVDIDKTIRSLFIHFCGTNRRLKQLKEIVQITYHKS